MQAVDIKMPVVITRKEGCEDTTFAGSDFSGDRLDDLVIFEELITGEKRQWRIKKTPSQNYSLVGYKKPDNKSVPFAKFKTNGESESLSDSAVLNSEFITSLTENEDNIFEFVVEDAGIIEYPKEILFSKAVEINTKELERWNPEIVIESFLLDDDE